MVLRHRAALARQRTLVKTRVNAVLADRGIDAPVALWAGPGRKWLANVDLPDVERQVVEDLCGLLDAIELPVARLERQIKELAKPDPRVDALQQMPGVGLLTAMTLVSEIGDISRFPDARKLCAWAGLTPTVRNSDRTVHHGQLTKQGPWRCAGCWSRRPKRPSAARLLMKSMTPSAAGGGARSPRSPSPGGCWPSPSTP